MWAGLGRTRTGTGGKGVDDIADNEAAEDADDGGDGDGGGRLAKRDLERGALVGWRKEVLGRKAGEKAGRIKGRALKKITRKDKSEH